MTKGTFEECMAKVTSDPDEDGMKYSFIAVRC